MAKESTIKVYRSLIAGTIPADLAVGEIAINIIDRKLYVGDDAGAAQVVGGAKEVFVSDDPPAAAPADVLWWRSNTGQLFVHYQDADSLQWVEVLSASGGSTGLEEAPNDGKGYQRKSKAWAAAPAELQQPLVRMFGKAAADVASLEVVIPATASLMLLRGSLLPATDTPTAYPTLIQAEAGAWIYGASDYNSSSIVGDSTPAANSLKAALGGNGPNIALAQPVTGSTPAIFDATINIGDGSGRQTMVIAHAHSFSGEAGRSAQVAVRAGWRNGLQRPEKFGIQMQGGNGKIKAGSWLQWEIW